MNYEFIGKIVSGEIGNGGYCCAEETLYVDSDGDIYYESILEKIGEGNRVKITIEKL